LSAKTAGNLRNFRGIGVVDRFYLCRRAAFAALFRGKAGEMADERFIRELQIVRFLRMSLPRASQLAATFARYANLTFGGGSATIAVLQAEIVDRRHWVAQPSFNLAYALSRLTPGTNLLAFCTAVGWLIRRLPGALLALAAASLPCSILALLVTAVYEWWSRNRIVMVSLRGAVAVVVAVMFATGWTLIRPHWQSLSWAKTAVIIGGAFTLGSFSFSPIGVLLIALITGWCWPTGAAR
jgi:chromate transporter